MKLRWIERVGWMVVGAIMAGSFSVWATDSMPDTIFRKLEVLAEVLGHVENYYVDSVSATELVYGAAQGAAGSLDEHSVFFPPDEYQSLVDTTEGEYAGIGVEMAIADGDPEIIAVFEHSPAERAGLKPGDKIVGIDDQPTAGQSFDTIYKRLRGPVGTKIVLHILRSDRPEAWKYTLVRNWIRVSPLEHRRLPSGINYVRIKSFPRRVASDLDSLLHTQAPKKGLILDMRGNPGGLFDEAVEICDLFLDGGPVVIAVGRGGRILEQRDAREREVVKGIPIAILQDRRSASAAEVVAGALHDRGRARLFGERSYGKGSVQSILDLSDGSGLKLTVARYVTPGGQRIDGHGITPDEPVDPADDGKLVAAAVAWLEAQP